MPIDNKLDSVIPTRSDWFLKASEHRFDQRNVHSDDLSCTSLYQN